MNLVVLLIISRNLGKIGKVLTKRSTTGKRKNNFDHFKNIFLNLKVFFHDDSQDSKNNKLRYVVSVKNIALICSFVLSLLIPVSPRLKAVLNAFYNMSYQSYNMCYQFKG